MQFRRFVSQCPPILFWTQNKKQDKKTTFELTKRKTLNQISVTNNDDTCQYSISRRVQFSSYHFAISRRGGVTEIALITS